jgi:hypothetical protein
MTDAEDIDLLALRMVLMAALDGIAEMPVDAPVRVAAVYELERALGRIAAVAGAGRRAARQGARMLARVVEDHRR